MTDLDRTAGTTGPLRTWRDLGWFALQSFVTGLFVSLVLGLAVFIVSFEAHAAGGAIDQACSCCTAAAAASSRRRCFSPTCISTLTLVTCYPFDAINPGGPLRYVVVAEKP